MPVLHVRGEGDVRVGPGCVVPYAAPRHGGQVQQRGSMPRYRVRHRQLHVDAGDLHTDGPYDVRPNVLDQLHESELSEPFVGEHRNVRHENRYVQDQLRPGLRRLR
jgi:hypothetical protein